jgi:UDP-N-acetyl-2-amino-2-deoxyglucuronate dehydrogenase
VSDRIKFAIVGLGHIGKRYADLIQRNPEAELTALCDFKDRTELGIEHLYAFPFFNSIDALLDSNIDFDILCICTPNGFHTEQAIKALNYNKNVLIEKPMGLNAKDCERVISKSKVKNKEVFTVMQNRYSPPAQWIKEILEKKLLGEIFMVQVNCYWNRDERYFRPNGKTHLWKGTKNLDGGTLFTQFSHFIDMIYWLFGDIKNIQARFANFNHQESIDFEDSGLVNFEFANGGFGTLNYSTSVWDKNLESSMTIIGSKGAVKIGGQYMNEVEYCNIEGYSMPKLPPANPANDYGHYKGSAANHVYVIENVIDVLKGRKTITTNALEGLKVVEIIEKIYQIKKQ